MAIVTSVPRHLILLFAVLLMVKAVTSDSPADGPSGSIGIGMSLAMSPSASGIDEEHDSDSGPEPEPKVSGVDTPRYISRAVLRKDRVPCERRGVSYYNCSTDQAVNPYTRGCTKITKCPKSFK